MLDKDLLSVLRSGFHRDLFFARPSEISTHLWNGKKMASMHRAGRCFWYHTKQKSLCLSCIGFSSAVSPSWWSRCCLVFVEFQHHVPWPQNAHVARSLLMQLPYFESIHFPFRKQCIELEQRGVVPHIDKASSFKRAHKPLSQKGANFVCCMSVDPSMLGSLSSTFLSQRERRTLVPRLLARFNQNKHVKRQK